MSTYDAWEEMRRQKFESELRAEINEKKHKRLETAIERCGLNLALKEKTFDSYVATEDWQKIAKASCQKYAENPERWLLVSGPSGCGKTHLCTAIVKSILDRGIPVWYMLYREEINRLKPIDGVEPDEREAKMWTFKTCQVLYIDDLFKGGASKADIKVMFELIDYRYRTNKTTIVSTELTMRQLVEVDAAIAGRIAEGAKKVLIKHEKDRNYRIEL